VLDEYPRAFWGGLSGRALRISARSAGVGKRTSFSEAAFDAGSVFVPVLWSLPLPEPFVLEFMISGYQFLRVFSMLRDGAHKKTPPCGGIVKFDWSLNLDECQGDF
jgi:hypothetical protein